MKTFYTLAFLFSAIIVFVMIVSALFSAPDVWTGYYYTDGCAGCSGNYLTSPQYDTPEECMAWAQQTNFLRQNSSDEYECGLNCKPMKDAMGVNLCEETIDYI
jgi:hypothetical protein